MLSAIGRLSIITAVVLIVVFLAVAFLRAMGSRQVYQAPPHAWFAQAQWNLYSPPLPDICAKTSASFHKGWILDLPVQRSGDTWEVPCSPQAIPLQEFLTNSQRTQFLLNIKTSDTTDLDKLVEICSHFENSGKSFAVQAVGQKVARELRKNAPQWLYASDQASLLRLHMFASLWLETSTEFWPDFVIASTNEDDGTRLSEREAKELHRRQKRILWNEDSGAKPSFPVDGIATSQPGQ
jgi:hypothetical protein